MKAASAIAKTANPNTVAMRFRTACAAKLLPLLLLLALPAVVQGQFNFTTNNDGTLNISACTGTNTVIIIPSTTNGLPVTTIGDYAFYDCTNLTSITIPTSITNIGAYVFEECISLTSVTIPDSVTSIGDWAFYTCTSLTNATIGNSVTNIGEGAFSFCTSLPAITVAANNPAYCSVVGVLFNKSTNTLVEYPDAKGGGSYTISNTVATIGDWAFYSCTSLTNITLNTNVTSIGDGAFADTSLTHVTIPNSVTNLGEAAFYFCTNLTSVTMGTNVTGIEDYAFEYCANLAGITVPNRVVTIGKYAFYFCTNLTSVTMGTNVTSIDDYAFEYCIMMNGITIPNSVTNIGYSAFYECISLTRVTIPNSVHNLGEGAFYKCYGLTNVIIGTNITSIADYAFTYCTSLASITIPNNVTNIGDSAFYGCSSLTSVTIPNAVTSIGDGAFFETSLTRATIPNSVTNLGIGVFYSCASLTNITLGTNVTSLRDYAFFECISLRSVTIPNSVTTIGDYAFDDCFSLTNLTLSTNVTSIGDYAFFDCASLHNVTIPNSVTAMGDYVFEDCTSLTNLTLGTNVTSIGVDAFASTSLHSVTIPNSVTNIGDYAFSFCTSLTNLTLGTNVASIGEAAFYSCTSLTSITIPNSVTNIGAAAFANTSLSAITVDALNPAYSSVAGVLFNKSTNTLIEFPGGKGGGSYTISTNVTSIGSWAFDSCTNLASITIPNSVTNLGDGAFYYCTNLISVYFQSNAPSLGGPYVFASDTNATGYYLPGTTGWAVFSANTTLPIVELTGSPILAITAPTAGLLVTNANYTIAGTAADSVAVTNVFYALNNSGWKPATTANNWTTWSAPVTLNLGTNTITAYAVDTSGNFSLTNRVSLDYVLTTVLTVQTNGHGTISPNYNGAVLLIGQSYTMTATASPGYGFSGWTGSSATNGATLTFVMASNLTFTANFVVVTNPTLTITAPAFGQRWSNAVFTVTGTARDNLQVSNVACQVNGGAWSNAATANVWTNWTAAVNLIPGTNTVAAYAKDTTGYVSTTNSVSFQYVATSQLQIRANGLGTVSPNYSNAWLEIGRNYSITSAPAAGFVFNNWVISTNWIGGTTTSKTNLTFMMASNLTLQVNFVDTNRPTVSITNLASGQRVTNAVFTVKGTASDNWQVSNVVCQLNGGAWSNAATANVWTNWTAVVNLIPGTNIVAAYAVDTSGNVSTTNSVSFQFVATNQLGVRAIGLGTISPNYSNAWLEIGRNYSITSTPASGFTFANWVLSTNWIGGTTMTKTNLQFMMVSNLTLQVTFTDVTKPTLAISAPAAGQHMTNALATVVGTASDNWKVSAVWYQLTNKILTSGTWNLATTTNNYTNWTTTITLAAGTNMVKAYAVDLGGNYSTTSSVSVLSSNTFKLQLNFALNPPLTSTGLNFTLQISSNLNGHIQISTNLLDWLTLTNFVGTNTTLNFRDATATNFNRRFYRAIIP